MRKRERKDWKDRHLLILCGETGATNLVHRHHDRHHVLPIHDGSRQDVLSLILGQCVHKVTEVGTLSEEPYVLCNVYTVYIVNNY